MLHPPLSPSPRARGGCIQAVNSEKQAVSAPGSCTHTGGAEAQGIQWTLACSWTVFILNCVSLLLQFFILHVCYCSFKWPLDAATGVLVKWSATGSPLPCPPVGGDELRAESGLCLQCQAGESACLLPSGRDMGLLPTHRPGL